MIDRQVYTDSVCCTSFESSEEGRLGTLGSLLHQSHASSGSQWIKAGGGMMVRATRKKKTTHEKCVSGTIRQIIWANRKAIHSSHPSSITAAALLLGIESRISRAGDHSQSCKRPQNPKSSPIEKVASGWCCCAGVQEEPGWLSGCQSKDTGERIMSLNAVCLEGSSSMLALLSVASFALCSGAGACRACFGKR